MTINKPLFTVFTGTYNRAAFLPRVYEGLCAQTLQDFEWVVVDDGSTDDTRQTIERIAADAPFPVRYIYKQNGGVHTAHNAAVSVANGEFFLRHDNDDEIIPTAIDRLYAAWSEIQECDRVHYSGVSSLCMDDHGEVIGDWYPSNPWDSVPAILANLKGEKWGFHRTEILRSYPFPEFNGEHFIPDSVVWARVGDHYRTRCINVPLRVFHDTPGSVSKKVPRLRYTCGHGYLLFYREELARPQAISRRLKLSVNYVRTCFGQRQSLPSILASTPRRFWTLVAMPVGVALYWRDRLRGLTMRASC